MYKNIFFLFLLFLATSSCSAKKDFDSPIDPGPVDPKDEKYQFSKLEFNGASATVEEFVENKPNLNYINRTNTTQNIVIDPKPIYEKSMFVPDENKIYTIVDVTEKISVPLQIENSEVSLGMEKWMYSTKESQLDTELNFKESVDVDPQTAMSIALAVVYTKITAPYTLTIKNIETDEFVLIKGQWIGVYPLRIQISIEISDL